MPGWETNFFSKLQRTAQESQPNMEDIEEFNNNNNNNNNNMPLMLLQSYRTQVDCR